MSNNKQTRFSLRKGLSSDLPTHAPLGEPLFCTDTGELYVGMGSGSKPKPVTNKELSDKLTTVSSQLDTIVKSNNEKTVNVKDFGAIGDGKLHLLSEKYNNLEEAQKVYPFATSLNDSIDWCAIQYCLNNFKNVFIPQGTFILNNTLIMPFNIRMFGINNSQSILKYTSDVYRLPSIQYGTEYSYGEMYGSIERIGIYALNPALPPYGIIAYSSLKVEMVRGFELLTFFEKAVNKYMDNIQILRCDVNYCKGDSENRRYVINVFGENDNLTIEELRGGSAQNYSEYGGIYVSRNRGGFLKNLIPGFSITIEDSECLNINGLHMENDYSFIKIINSSVNIDNVYKWKRIDGEDFIFIGESGIASYKNCAVSLNNCIIDIQESKLSLITNYNEINKTGYVHLSLKNCFKEVNMKTNWTDVKTKIGFTITDLDKFNILSPNASVLSIVDELNNVYTDYTQTINVPSNTNTFRYSNTSNKVPWLFSETARDYYYRGVFVIDEERKLALYTTDEKSFNVNGYGVILQNADYNINGSNKVCLKLYRGNKTGLYHKYVYLPIVLGANALDFGSNIMGCQWQGRTESAIDSYNNVTGFRYINNNKNIEFYSSSKPSVGSFVKGDRCINTSFQELGISGSKYIIKEWLCGIGGSSPTWIEIRTLTGN